MFFWYPKFGIKLDNHSDKSTINGELGEFFEQKEKTIFLRPALSKRKIIYISCFFLTFFLILIFRAAYLQIVRGSYYNDLAENNRIRTYIIPAYRGIIYDRNNTPLVKNRAIFTLSLIPNKLPSDTAKKDELLQIISEVINKPKEDIEAILTDFQSYPNEAVLIHNNLSHKAILTLTKYSSQYPAIVITEQIEREYVCEDAKINNTDSENKCPQSLSHILGYLGPISKEEYEKNKNNGYYLHDYIGKTGIEMQYEELLRGRFGKKQIEIDALGQEKRIIAKEEATPGKNLILSIDVKMQDQLEKIIKEYLRKYNKKRAAAVVMNPNNGEILAMVSLPAFSNNDFMGGVSPEVYNKLISDPNQPLFFRAISGEYPSGSVIKPLWASAALEEGIINSQTTFLSTGGLKVGSWFFPDWKPGGHGPTNVTKAIAESINTFFYYICGGFGDFKGLGLDKLLKYATIFGIGEKTGIDLPFERQGFLPSEEWKMNKYNKPWYIGDTYHLAIGQGFLLVTPLQIAVLTSAVANGGNLIVPHLLKETISDKGNEETPLKIKRKNLIKPENIEIVKRGMREAVLYGSARKLADVGVEVAGKTGTAQTSPDRPPHAWFSGFFPFKEPKLVITVLVEEGGEGSGIATQIAKDFIEQIKNY